MEVATDVVPDNVTGLGTFFSNAMTDELLATIDLVVLPTLYKDITLVRMV